MSPIIYDSRRLPLWLRVPALIIGLIVLWIGAVIATFGLFGIGLGLDLSSARGSWLFGSLACFAIAAVWIFIWFIQVQVLFDEVHQQLIVRKRGYFRFQDRRISMVGCHEVHMRHVPAGKASMTWEISVEYSDGRSEHIISIKSGIESLSQSIKSVAKLPVKRFEDEIPLEQRTNAQILGPLIGGTLICVAITGGSFFSHQPTLFLWTIRIFGFLWLVRWWSRYLGELSRRKSSR